jgi:ABC-type transport system substrate-binding protein
LYLEGRLMRIPIYLFLVLTIVTLGMVVGCGNDPIPTPRQLPTATPITIPPGIDLSDIKDLIESAAAAAPAPLSAKDITDIVQKELAERPEITSAEIKAIVEAAKPPPPTPIAFPTPIPAPTLGPDPTPTGPWGEIKVGRAELGAYICDPKNTAGVADVGMQGHETLFYVNVKDEVVPKLVKSWTLSDDFLTWTFELNKGVQFTKGYGELTAADVVFTLMRGTEDGSSMPRAGALREKWRNPDGSVEIIDDYTIRVNTGSPAVGMLPELSTPYAGFIVSKKQIDEVGWAAASDNCATSGPWDITTHRTSDFFTWTAVENHWRKTPEFAKLTLREIPEESTRLAGFQTGKLDTFVMAFDTLPSVENMPGVKLMESSPGATMHLGIYGNYYTGLDRPGYDPSKPWISPNADVNSPEWEKARKVRKAITIAIDRETIVKELVRGKGSPLTLWGWENKEDKLPAGVKWSYDPVLAKQLLVEAGYPDGFKTKLMVYPRQVPGDVAACTAVGGMLEKIGIQTEMAPMPYASASPLIRARDWSYLNCHGTGATREPLQLMGLMLSTSGFNMGFEHATVDQLVAEARVIFDVAKRFDKEREVAQFVFDNALETGVYTASVVWPLGPELDPWFSMHQDRGDPRALYGFEYTPHRR